MSTLLTYQFAPIYRLFELADAWVGLINFAACKNSCNRGSTLKMAVFEEWQIVAISVLAFFFVLVIAVLLLACCLFMRKRELLCFRVKRTSSDRESRAFGYEDSRPAKRRRKRLTGGPSREFKDPFAKQFSDPLTMDDDLEDLNLGKTIPNNPLFDIYGGRKKDAAITIQTWWRMTR